MADISKDPLCWSCLTASTASGYCCARFRRATGRPSGGPSGNRSNTYGPGSLGWTGPSRRFTPRLRRAAPTPQDALVFSLISHEDEKFRSQFP